MKIKITALTLCATLFGLCLPALAQQPGRVPRIGYLTGTPLSPMPFQAEAFRQGLRDLGYFEGKNIVIEWRSHEGNQARQRALVAELVRLKVDVIAASGSGDIRAAKAATATIPIVMIGGGDAVGSGFVDSLARPGGNITGLSTLSPELSGKRLELLKEIVPKLSRVAVFWTSSSGSYAPELKEVELAAGALGMRLQNVDVLAPKDIAPHFESPPPNGPTQSL
jgi:putative ABC transport system substrate-binding protein